MRRQKKYYKKALEIDKNFVNARANLANLYFSTGKIPDGIIECEKNLIIDPFDELTYKVLITAFINEKLCDNAIFLIKKGLNPDKEIYYSLLGGAYMQKADMSKITYDEVITELNEIVRIHPDFAIVYYYLALAYEKKGMLAESLNTWDKLLKMKQITVKTTEEIKEHIEKIKEKFINK
jgi:tetratricopeptide (TPR) repeat protein